ncbi:hypothetical protein JW899_00450 [Candidatus Uhrbacteria bacterium]|nr:hypothetical protein [Candidatus Uhrbacteria bacterium]
MLKNQSEIFRKTAAVLVLSIGGAFTPVVWGPVWADTMTSDSYRIPSDVLSVGGNRSTSGGYVIEDTIGEMATGEGLASSGFLGCAGYQCFVGADYLSFSVREGTEPPGTAGVGVDLGILLPTSVKGSDNFIINSVFITAESTASGGAVITVASGNGGLASASVPGDIIGSETASLTPGTEGYGICVTSVSESDDSPSDLLVQSPYGGTCNTDNGHDVGVVDGSSRPILGSSGQLADGQSEILVKAAVGYATVAHSDYSDNLTFIMTGTF